MIKIPLHPLAAFKSLCLTALLACVSSVQAAPPDLTNGGVPGDTISFNMGTTGARGWVYHVRENSAESRQIQIKSVAPGSPAVGILAANDVILGANGTGAAPSDFTYDARKALADAINDAEARDPATLQLIRWRAGSTSTVTLTLRFMGAYSATAPYNCPKSSKILEEGLQFIVNNNETAGTFSFGTLGLLAGNDPGNPNNTTRRNRAETQARAMVPNATTRAQLMSDARDTNWVWDRGHTLIMLAEYFLLTGDEQVIPGIEAYAVNIAKNTSLFGNTGHMYARKNPDGSPNGALGNGYGAVNSAALPCYLGLLLAKKCGLTNPEIDPAIQRSTRYFAYFSGKGAVPYGDHEPYWQGHEANGKSGLAAVCLGLVPARTDEAKFFARMAVAAASERGEGHTGAFFNYLWAPLGAAVGGADAAASHFSRIRWMLDLNRKWDGSFDYDCLNGEGDHSGAQYAGFRMSTAALLTYALPLRQLHITGKDSDPVLALDSAQVAAAAAADAYNPQPRTTAELIADLGNWSPMVHRSAAIELATRTINSTALNQITSLANDPDGSSRYGAILTLGRISDSSTAAARADTLVALLGDPDNHVRFMAAEAMRSLPQAIKAVHLNHLLALCASQARPLLPLVEEDPMQLAHGRLCILLFRSDGGVIQNDLTGVDRNLLFPALRAAMTHPNGSVRSALPRIYSMLNKQETLELADAFVDAVRKPIPCDRMFGKDTQAPTLAKLAQYKVAEVVPLTKVIINREDTSSIKTDVLAALQTYRSASTMVRPDPEIIPFLEALKASPDTADAAQAVLNAIAADSNPVPATPLKSLPTISADLTILTLPTAQTTLRATGFDYAKGDSVFTWRKVHGKGSATFTPNGTAAAKDSAVLIDPQPGKYLFEVTMSDSRNLTEVSKTVAVTLLDSSGVLPPNSPPVASPQSIAVPRGLPVSILLGGSDPEAYPLAYRIVTPPADGTLTGTPPNLTYTASAGGVATSDSFTFEVMDSEGQVDDATVHLFIDNSVVRGAITWNTPSDITGTANVSTNGTLFASYTGHNAGGDVTVNGVTFAQGRIPNAQSSNANIGNRVPATGNSTYNTFLRSICWNYTGGKVAITGLTPGANYQIQIWAADNAETPAGKRSLVLGHDTASVASLVHEPPSGAPGQFTTGTFTAAGTTQEFTIASYDDYGTPDQAPAGSAITNGMQIRLLPDSTPPFPNPVAWSVPPYSHGIDSIRMVAVTAYDSSGVEYYFAETSGNPGGSDSGWQGSPAYLDSGLTQGLTYSYTVQVRDKSPAMNMTSVLPAASVTLTDPDTSPPAPNPMTWALYPSASGTTAITMTAITATDSSGVEYFFDETSGNPGGTDSGWQTSPTYVDTGLSPGTTYTYTVKARDKSPARLQTAASAPASASTNTLTFLNKVWNVNFHNQITTSENFEGAAPENTANSTWNRIGGTTNSLPVTARALADSTGSTTAGVNIDLSSATFGGAARTNTANQTIPGGLKIFNGYIGGDLATSNLTINGLNPTKTYDLVLYSYWWWIWGGDSGLPVSQTLGTGLDERIFVNRTSTGTNGTPAITLVRDPDPANLPGDHNYYRITGLTPDAAGKLAFQVGAFGTSGSGRANTAFNGFQLIEVTSLEVDTTHPSPSPMSFATPPTALGQTSITMTATTATDSSGVEYFFKSLTPGGHDSGWQDSPEYTDNGLNPGTEYHYQVQARDKSSAQNTTAFSASAAATTHYPPPSILTLVPADDSSDVAITTDLTAAFDRSITLTGAGTVTLRNLTDSTETLITLPNSQVSASGETLTINPTADFLPGKNYAVRISADAISGLNANAFPGIGDDTTWDFLTFSPATTTTTLDTSGSPATYGDPVTLTATVIPTPDGGTVQFYDNDVALGSPAPLSNGQAQLVISTLTTGSHTITATFSGTGNYGGSTATAITQTVDKAAPVIITPPTATDITAGQTLASSTLTGGVGSVPGTFTFTAPATEPPVGTASHSVTFTPNDTFNYHAATTSMSVTVNAARTSFETWAADPAHGLTAGVNDNPLDDPDSDGFANLMEFVLGGLPMVSSQAIQPKLTQTGGNWVYSYHRSHLSKSSITQVVEYGNGLTGWTPMPVPVESEGAVTITPGATSDHVEVSIPPQGAGGFVRLKAASTP